MTTTEETQETSAEMNRHLGVREMASGVVSQGNQKRWHLSWIFFFYFCFLGPYLQNMEVPRLGVRLELQVPAYTTATATWDPSHICHLHCSLWQHWILNTMTEARDWTCFLMDASWVHNQLSHNGNSQEHASDTGRSKKWINIKIYIMLRERGLKSRYWVISLM